jgi:flagellin-like hook-associated protein FlgL
MAGVVPIPNTRVSQLLSRERLLSQLQSDQLDLLRLQDQVSTGRRISRPSDDAAASQRAITLQRLLERKAQLKANVTTGQSFLAVSDSALTDVASTLGSIRGAALGVAGTTATDGERNEVVNDVNNAINALVGVGNTRYLGRYLFAGSQTNVRPYDYSSGYVRYSGNSKLVKDFSDIDVLFATNAPGQEVFGGISAEATGSADLNPQVTADTLLSSLRRGHGISAGAIQISDGTHSSTIDLSRAVTVGDVARLIEEHPPAGRTVSASITGTGLTLQLDPAGGGNLTVVEVASGRTASDLGILQPTGVLTAPLVGGDLDPVVLKTTRLDDLLGTRARARLSSPGANNDLLIEAAVNGAQYNGVAVQVVDSDLLNAGPGVATGGEYAQYATTARAAQASLRFTGAGNDLVLTSTAAGVADNNVTIVVQGQTGLGNLATATYDSGNKVLRIQVDDAGATSIDAVITAVNATGSFTAAHDPTVEGSGTYNPAALVDAGDIGNVGGSTGNSGGAAGTLYVYVASAGASTANQVAAAINSQGTFRAVVDPADTASAAQTGTAAVALTATATTAGGSGTVLDRNSGITVVNGGVTSTYTFAGAETVEDFLNVLNAEETGLAAEINANGTGINIRSRISGGDFQIGENGGQTATQLGVRTFNGATRLEELNHGVGVPTKPSQDFNIALNNLSFTTRSGQVFNVDMSSSATVGDAATAMATVLGTSVAVSAGPNGGLTLVDNTIGTGELQVRQSGATSAISGGLPLHTRSVDFSVTARNGAAFNVSLEGAETIQDAIDAINAASGGQVTAGLAPVGNGIQLTDNTGGSGPLTVTSNEGSQAAEFIGLVAKGSTSASVGSSTLVGADRKFLESSSVFTTLIRLRDALSTGDTNAIERAISAIDDDIARTSAAHAQIGAREQALDVSTRALEDEDVQLRSALSNEIDVDLVEAISNLTARQTSLQASLQAMANMLQLSLLNFL